MSIYIHYYIDSLLYTIQKTSKTIYFITFIIIPATAAAAATTIAYRRETIIVYRIETRIAYIIERQSFTE